MQKLRVDWLRFQEIHKVKLSFKRYKQILAEEQAALAVEAQREKDGHLMPSDQSEPNAKCCICGSGLLVIENMMFSNKCAFCAPTSKESLPLSNIRLFEYLLYCWYDWLIYQQVIRLWKIKGNEEARMLYLGCLGAAGFSDINQAKDIPGKKRVLKEMRGC